MEPQHQLNSRYDVQTANTKRQDRLKDMRPKKEQSCLVIIPSVIIPSADTQSPISQGLSKNCPMFFFFWTRHRFDPIQPRGPDR